MITGINKDVIWLEAIGRTLNQDGYGYTENCVLCKVVNERCYECICIAYFLFLGLDYHTAHRCFCIDLFRNKIPDDYKPLMSERPGVCRRILNDMKTWLLNKGGT